jgi:hypothetical protein
MIAESNLVQKQKKAAFNKENGLFDIWLPLVHSFQNISKTIKETILVAEANINSGFLVLSLMSGGV